MRSRVLVMLVVVSMSFGFSWIDQNKKENNRSEQHTLPSSTQSIASSQLASNPVIESIKSAQSPDNQVVSTGGIVRPVLPEGFTQSTRQAGYGSLREMAQSLQSIRSVTEIVNSGVIIQAQSLRDNSFLGRDPEILKIQKQINEVLKVHDQFKSLENLQVHQLEQITAHVRSHRDMVNSAEAKQNRSTDYRTADVNEILRQQVLREEKESE